MKLLIISGRSGSGKSTALNVLEDAGYSCIDNLPASLLPALVDSARAVSEQAPPAAMAVSIDARNLPHDLRRFPDILNKLEQDAGHEGLTVEIIYLDAELPTLVKRFSETRRKHPLSDSHAGLAEALQAESELLEGIANLADLVVDTTGKNLHGLREEITSRVVARQGSHMSLMFRSFAFSRGVPVDADFVMDVRCLPNPHWVAGLRDHTGRDAPVAEYLQASEDGPRMLADIVGLLERWLPNFVRSNRSYMTIAIGCTGGKHRSVWLSEQLAAHFGATTPNVLVRHRELDGQG